MTDKQFHDISLVIINYNSQRFLPDIFAYLDELAGKIEINIVDDCSNDGSIEKLGKRYGESVKITINLKNSGASFTRNFALKNIRKKYLLFLDPDVRAEPNDLLELIKRRSRADIVFPQVDYFNGGTISPVNDFEKARCTNSAIYVINREKVEECRQYFDEDMFVYNEDSDVFSRWWAFGFSFKFYDDIIVKHPEKTAYSEKLFFYRVRNPFILFIKQAGIIKFRMNPFVWIFAYTGLNFLAAVFNRNFSVAQGGFEEVKVSDREGVIVPRLRLLAIFFRAIFWNLININKNLQKRKKLQKQMVKLGKNDKNNKNRLDDQKTANSFSKSWNNLPRGSVYTQNQFEEWFEPLTEKHVAGRNVLELGCGNSSLMMHLSKWKPKYLVGVDMGESVKSAETNMSMIPFKNWKIIKEDLTKYHKGGFDIVYCIGVLHHMQNPEKGFESVLKNTRPGGMFHCWVYAREGNGLIVYFVDPLRKVVHYLPWWVIKYFIATPLVFPYFLYAKLVNKYKDFILFKKLPLYEYSLWIAKRDFYFFQHVAFDQLVTPKTTYIKEATVVEWLKKYPNIDQGSTYIINRNGISWKFGGKLNYNNVIIDDKKENK